jgi:hypothetical protein
LPNATLPQHRPSGSLRNPVPSTKRSALEANLARDIDTVLEPSQAHDDEAEVLISTRTFSGVHAESFLQEMVGAALRGEWERGTLTQQRQHAYARLSVAIADTELTGDPSAVADQCRPLVDGFLTLVRDESTAEGASVELTPLDHETVAQVLVPAIAKRRVHTYAGNPLRDRTFCKVLGEFLGGL